MYKKLTIGASLILVLASLVGLIQTQQTRAVDVDNEDKITICHATHSDEQSNNPYNKIDVSVNAADGQAGNSEQEPDHFGEHNSPNIAWNQATHEALKDGQEEWGDIIPPILGVHGGLNWTAIGQAVYYNDCNYVTSVTPVVTFTAPTCKALGSYTIPETAGVEYSINGTVVLAGDYTAPNGSTVTVVATAQKGFVIEGTSEWTYTFTAPTNCDENGQVLGTTNTPSGTAGVLPVTSGDSTAANVTLISAAVSLVTLLSLVARSVLTRQI